MIAHHTERGWWRYKYLPVLTFICGTNQIIFANLRSTISQLTFIQENAIFSFTICVYKLLYLLRFNLLYIRRVIEESCIPFLI